MPTSRYRHQLIIALLTCVCALELSFADHEASKHHHRGHRSHRSHRSHHGLSNEVILPEWSKEPHRRPNAIPTGGTGKTGANLKAAASASASVAPPIPLQMFLSENCSVVLAQTGSTPIMHCEVQDIGEGTVSWIRRKDYHLLTVGLTTYSSDDRFFAAHVMNPQDWALHVRFVQAKDAGLYECQVPTHPPTSLFVELRLVEATAEILNGPDKFVKSGSTLQLTCLLRDSTEPPAYVFWYHDARMINFDEMRGVRVRHGRYSSELVIGEAHRHDSGNYTCVPSNAQPASVSVHILNGEEPAAMQHGSKSDAATSRQYSPLASWHLTASFAAVATVATLLNALYTR